MAFVDCYGKQTPKGPNYIPTDKFSYSKDPIWKIGTAARNTLDGKPKYEHYFRKDIDVILCIFSLISTKPTKPEDWTSETQDLVEIPEYFFCLFSFLPVTKNIKWLLGLSIFQI
jgi:hypothetical protein